MPRPKINANPAKTSMNPMAIKMNSKMKAISATSESLRRYSVASPRRTRTTPTAWPVRTEPDWLQCYLRD